MASGKSPSESLKPVKVALTFEYNFWCWAPTNISFCTYLSALKALNKASRHRDKLCRVFIQISYRKGVNKKESLYLSFAEFYMEYLLLLLFKEIIWHLNHDAFAVHSFYHFPRSLNGHIYAFDLLLSFCNLKNRTNVFETVTRPVKNSISNKQI